MKRILLYVQYDGTEFHGWQRQPGGLRTVQAVLEAALSQMAAEPINAVAAGRTDRGVHAVALPVHFDTKAQRPITAWVAGVNALLPRDMAVLAAEEVARDFHARFDAYARRYVYILNNARVRPVLWRQRAGWTFSPLDAALMHQAAQDLVGEHDFSSFRAAECQADTPIKTLYHARVWRQGAMIYFDFEASGFLHHMVRNIVGALIFVGKGRLDLASWRRVIAACDRRQAPPTFMADGLYLMDVRYPEKWQLTGAPTASISLFEHQSSAETAQKSQ